MCEPINFLKIHAASIFAQADRSSTNYFQGTVCFLNQVCWKNELFGYLLNKVELDMKWFVPEEIVV